jgi:MFS family permease
MSVKTELPPLRRNRDFLLLWTGAGSTLLGTRVTVFAYPLLALWATQSASAAGLVMSAALLPQLLVQLPAGVLVDRVDRRRLMVLADIGCVLLTASVAIAVMAGHTWVVHLIVVAFLQGSLAICYDLAERSAVRHVVPAEQLPAALSQNEARARAAGMLGQPIGSALFAFVRWSPFVFTVVAHLVSLVTLLLIRRDFQGERPARRDFRTEVAEGLRWIWGQRLLRTAMVLISVSNIVFAGLGLAVMFIVKEDGGSAAVLGVITAIGGVGGMVGALTASRWLRRLSMRSLLVGGFTTWALTVVPVAFVSHPIALGVAFAAFGYIGGVFNVAGGVYLVTVAPDAMMGRAVSVMTLLGSGLAFLGGLTVGPLLDTTGATTTVLGMAGVMAALALGAITSPTVRAAVNTVSGTPLR